MTVHSFWQQTLDENAVTTRKLSQLLWPGTDGVRNEPGSPLLVQAQSTPDMTVKVNAGWAKSAGYLGYNDAVKTPVTIDTANALLPRIDLVVMEWFDTENGDGTSYADVVVLPGTPNASPSPPSTAGKVVQELAQVFVDAGATSIDGSAITDVRNVVEQSGHTAPVSGTVTGVTTDANGYYTVTHGLPFTPTNVSVTVTTDNPTAVAGVLYVSSITSTTFKVRFWGFAATASGHWVVDTAASKAVSFRWTAHL